MLKTNTRETKVKDFHVAMGLPVNYESHTSLLELRKRLIQEETNEVLEALEDIQVDHAYSKPVSDIKWENLLKELCDLQYVLSGTLVSLRRLNSVDFDVAFNRVHKSNMSKLDDEGNPILDNNGKVTKGPNYKKPDLGDCI